MYTGDGPDYCGDIHCCSIQLDACVAKQKAVASLLNSTNVGLPLAPRKKIHR